MRNTGLVPRKVQGDRYGGSRKKQSALRTTVTPETSPKLPYSNYHRPRRAEEPLREPHIPWKNERRWKEVQVNLEAIEGLRELALKQGKEFHAELYQKFLAIAERYVGNSGPRTVVVTVIGDGEFPHNRQAGKFKKVKMVSESRTLPSLGRSRVCGAADRPTCSRALLSSP